MHRGPLGWRRDQWGATDTYLDKLLKNNEKTFGTSPAFKEWITARNLTYAGLRVNHPDM
jgi:hypothetical protein